MTDVRQRLFALREEPFAAFQRRLIPTVAPERILGVRTPAIRALARALDGTPAAAAFLCALPHETFEENQLHAFLIERIRPFDQALAAVEAFLPFVDNWATCDQLVPGVFKKAPGELLEPAGRWMDSQHVYTVRYGIGVLMRYFLGERFEPTQAERVAALRSSEYYVRMMQAWYVATALDRQYDAVLPLLLEQRLAPWTHNKAIQKAIESRRIPEERKAYLRTLRAGQD